MLRISGVSSGWFFYVVYGLLFLFTCTNPFFWDTIHLASMQAQWYYNNDFSHFILPPEFDSGHPPLFSILLALWWKTFKPTLFFSHLLMLPFLLLMLRQVILLCRYLYDGEVYLFAAAIVLFNTIAMGQSALVSPDIVLYSFFFFTLNGVLRNKKWKILAGALLLSAISMRGMMCVVCLFAFQCSLMWYAEKRFVLKDVFHIFFLYLPAVILFAAFLFVHYNETGWIGYHKNSPWSPSYRQVDVNGILKNIAILGWRFLDFGNAFIWLVFGTAVLFIKKPKLIFSKRSGLLFTLLIILLLILVIPQLFYEQLLAHRYLFPVIAIASLFIFSVADENINRNTLKKFSGVVVAGMLSGVLWVYPDNISKGWDSTPAHLPYYGLREKALDYIHAKKIIPGETGASFPYNEPAVYIDLGRDTERFAEKNFQQNKYILYSNIANDFTDAELKELKSKWIAEKQFGNWPVRFVLYKNPAYK